MYSKHQREEKMAEDQYLKNRFMKQCVKIKVKYYQIAAFIAQSCGYNISQIRQIRNKICVHIHWQIEAAQPNKHIQSVWVLLRREVTKMSKDTNLKIIFRASNSQKLLNLKIQLKMSD